MNEKTYTLGDREISLARLTLGRYQKSLKLIAKLSIEKVVEVVNKIRSEALAAAIEGKTTEVEIDLVPILGVAKEAILEAADQDSLIGLAAIALDTTPDEAADLDWDIGLDVITDFFTANPKLLTASMSFFTSLISSPRASQSTTPEPDKPTSKQTSTDSLKKPKSDQGEKKKKKGSK